MGAATGSPSLEPPREVEGEVQGWKGAVEAAWAAELLSCCGVRLVGSESECGAEGGGCTVLTAALAAVRPPACVEMALRPACCLPLPRPPLPFPLE